MISIMVGHFDYKHRCLIEKNVPIVLILASRWQDGAESLGMELSMALDYESKRLALHVLLFTHERSCALSRFPPKNVL